MISFFVIEEIPSKKRKKKDYLIIDQLFIIVFSINYEKCPHSNFS